MIEILQQQSIMGNCQSDQILDDTHVPVLGRLGPVTDLKIVNCVWERDYQGLFDYESKEIKKHCYTTKTNSLIFNSKDQKILKQTTQSDYKQQILKNAIFEIVKKSNYFKILPIYIENELYTIQKLLWLIIKSVPGHRYALKERDIIKFGKQKIKVRELVHHDSNISVVDTNTLRMSKKIYEDLKLKAGQQLPNNNSKLNHLGKEHPSPIKDDIINEIQSIATENQPTCRICLEPGEYTNPLICACKCTGSVRYIHLQCLRTWLGKRLNVIKSKFSIIIKWVPLNCQMCKTLYKYRIYLDNKKFYTVQIPKPAKPYVVFQVMKKSAEYSKIFHFISLSQTSKVSIGRKKDVDIKISDDISVSRHHANLLYDFENKKFMVEDNKSKFGTLVLIKKNLLINPFQRGISFQIGGEIFVFQSIRGQGSIPDYHDQQQFLNVVQNGEKSKTIEQQQSDQNNDEEEFEDQQDEEGNIPTNLNLNQIPNSSGSIPQNQSSVNLENSQLNIQPTSVQLRPSIVEEIIDL